MAGGELDEEEAINVCKSKIAVEVSNNLKFEDIIVHGCVIGPSGVGKSALVNSLCSLRGADRLEENSVECTSEPITKLSSNGGYKIDDIPGAGTLKVLPQTYAEQYNLAKFDFIIVLLAHPRLKAMGELNNWAKELAQVDLKKPIFLVYSRFDEFVNGYYSSSTEKDETAPFLRDLPEHQQVDIINNAKNKLIDTYNFPHNTFFIGRPLNPNSQADKNHVFDFENLKYAITDSLDPLKRDAVILHFKGYTKEWVERKKESLKRMMIAMAIGSAASGAIPVPGPSIIVDIGMAMGFTERCKKVFGLEDSDIKQNFSPQIAALFIPRVLAIVGTIGASIAFTTLNDAIKTVPIIGTVIGSVGGVVISGPLMYASLHRIRGMFATIVMEMMEAEAKAQASQHYGVSS